VHYVSDVVAGLVLGVCALGIAVIAVRSAVAAAREHAP
jgi:hypothetical protein